MEPMGTNQLSLEEAVRAASADALAPRREMYEALLAAPTYLLHAGEGKGAGHEAELGASDLNLWAEPDTALGGVWVPLFSTPQSAARYARSLESEERLRWVSQAPGRVYALLTAIGRIAGARLDPAGGDGAGLEWTDLHALSQGRIPEDGPRLYELPADSFRMPEGLRGRFGKLEPSRVGFAGRQVVFPDEAPLALEDFRRWVRLTLDDGGAAWTPCRHFAILLAGKAAREQDPELEAQLIAVLIEFEMFGDAEAVCARLVLNPGRAGFALGQLARVYRRSGRLAACVRICEEGLRDYPEEPALNRNLELCRAALRKFA